MDELEEKNVGLKKYFEEYNSMVGRFKDLESSNSLKSKEIIGL